MVFHHAQPGREFLVGIRFGVSKIEEGVHPFAPDYMLTTQTERSWDSLCYSSGSLEHTVCQGTQTQPEDGIEKCTETAIVFTKDACLCEAKYCFAEPLVPWHARAGRFTTGNDWDPCIARHSIEVRKRS